MIPVYQGSSFESSCNDTHDSQQPLESNILWLINELRSIFKPTIFCLDPLYQTAWKTFYLYLLHPLKWLYQWLSWLSNLASESTIYVGILEISFTLCSKYSQTPKHQQYSQLKQNIQSLNATNSNKQSVKVDYEIVKSEKN